MPTCEQDKRGDGPDVLLVRTHFFERSFLPILLHVEVRNVIECRKLMNMVPRFLENTQEMQGPLVGENGLTVGKEFEDLDELSKCESDDFMLNH
ncbi:hypothetical protein Tco_0223660 [Tanacetum coccineum]